MPLSDGATPSQHCTTSTFKKPTLFGGEITSIVAAEVHNYSLEATNTTNLNYCSVNVTYTHPGYKDSVLVEVWLPLTGWNSRFLGVGGGGYAAGYDTQMGPFVQQGYVAAVTNAGLIHNDSSPATWALNSPGNVNYDLLVNFASKSLGDLPIIGKAIAKDFFGTLPKHSYWSGCSNGGRQGLVSAQRYPNNYDGILAAAPAAYWTRLLPSLLWAQVVMHEVGHYPPLCEFEAFTAAAIQACDGLDGVVDGVISAPQLCTFNPHSVVGTKFNCSGTQETLSAQAATIVQKIWQGPRTTNGSFIWYGYDKDASLSIVANTTHFSNGTGTSNPWIVGSSWYTYFLAKDPNFDFTAITYNDYDRLTHQSIQEYDSVIGDADPDLSAFKAAGGKMITWHGVADEIIPTNNSIRYHEDVKALDPNVDDFYRLFLAPGIGHCGGGPGYYPADALDALVSWVEKDVAPTKLSGVSLVTGGSQPLCEYPQVARWDGSNNSSLASAYTCEMSYA